MGTIIANKRKALKQLKNIRIKKYSVKSNDQITKTNTENQQVYFQLQKIFANKKMCNGKKLAPTFAVIFMSTFEETHTFPLIKEKMVK